MLKWNYTYISSITNDEFTRYYLLMNNEKQKKVAAYKNIDDKKRTIAGEILARKMISSFCNVFPEDVFFELGLHGKPYVKNLDVEFNISHSDEMVVCAISDNSVGIDIERVRPIGVNILRRVCTDVDLEYIFGDTVTINNIPDNFNDKQLCRFYEVWTAKEAYFKYIGTGIKNLKSISMNELFEKRQIVNISDYIITIITNVIK